MRRLALGWAWPLLLLAAVLLLAWALGLPELLASGALLPWLRAAQGYAAAHPLPAAFAYVVLYTALVAVSVPTGTVLTVSGGALFGPALGTALAAVVGACDGDLPLGVICAAIAELLEVDEGELLDEVLPSVRELVEMGILSIV